MIVVMNGFANVGPSIKDYSKVFEDFNNENTTLGQAIDNISSIVNRNAMRYFEEANALFSENVKINLTSMHLLFNMFDGVNDAVIDVDCKMNNIIDDIITIEDISKIRVTRGTQIVQTMESNSSSKSYIHIYSKMFYEDWRTGSKIIKIDVFNRDIKDFKNFIDSTFTYSKEWMFRYADPFKIDQIVGFIYAPFISSNQLRS